LRSFTTAGEDELKRMIVIAGVALWFWHCTAAANLVSIDVIFPDVEFDTPPGSTVTFRVSYDSNAPNISQDPDPTIAAYDGKVIFISDGTPTGQLDATLEVVNVAPGSGGTDEFAIFPVIFPNPPPPYPIVGGRAVDSAEFIVLSDAGDMLNGVGLPTSPDFASMATGAILGLHRVDIEGQDNQLFLPGEFAVVSSPVPEPSTYIMMVVGLVALLVTRGKCIASSRP
jgi:hypothetical protein